MDSMINRDLFTDAIEKIRLHAIRNTIIHPFLATTHGALYNTDCFNILKLIRSDSIDCVFADPPFNLGKEYNNGFTSSDDKKTTQEYLDWCYRWIDECIRVLIPGGSLFVYSLPRWAYRFSSKIDNGTMLFRHWVALSMKSTMPLYERLTPAHYALLYFTKGKPRVFNKIRIPITTCRHCGRDIKDYGGYKKYLHPDGLNLTDFWDDTSPNRHKGFKTRPGVNELKAIIPARAIQMSTEPNDIILDPFGGGGSTYQEAQRLNRYWIGAEIGDCSAIVDRMNIFSKQSIRVRPPKTLAKIFY